MHNLPHQKMHKLFQSHHGHIYTTLKNHYKTSKFLLPISHSHSFSKTHNPNSKLDPIIHEAEPISSSKPTNQTPPLNNNLSVQSKPIKGIEQTVKISHPWSEWVDLMELLMKKGYFEANENPFQSGELGNKEANCIRTACLNFARDRFGLIRFLSRKDIEVIVGCGCPILDRKVVNSGKRLRAHVGIDEGNVCSSCNLRGDCERALVKAREDEGGRTVDVMRFLLTYGLESISGDLENKQCQNKMIKESTRKLLKEMVAYGSQQLDCDISNGAPLEKGAPMERYSGPQEKGHINVPMKQGDWHCPKCNFINFARNVECLRCNDVFQERLKQLSEDQDHLPLKKGDWICQRCNFLNFAKNIRCLQCNEKPPKRHLNPGEWECESCNYINFRRNMVCLKCDYKRPKASKSLKTTTHPEDDNGGFPNHSRLRFLSVESETNDNKSVEPKLANQSKGADSWRFVDEESKGNALLSCNEDFTFVDFPIMGGKSSLSKNAERREKWARDMVERGKSTAKSEENDKEFRYVNTQRRLEHLELTDDGDLAEWFGHDNNLEMKISVSSPKKTLDKL